MDYCTFPNVSTYFQTSFFVRIVVGTYSIECGGSKITHVAEEESVPP